MLTATSTGTPFNRSHERLFPFENVSSLHLLRGRVVERDHAWNVHAKGDELAAIPAHILHVLCYGGVHDLLVLEQFSAAAELVGGPRERRQAGQLPDIGDLETDVHESTPVAT